MIWIIIYIVSLLWILHRIFAQHAFLLWDWSDGKMEFMWNKGDDDGLY